MDYQLSKAHTYGRRHFIFPWSWVFFAYLFASDQPSFLYTPLWRHRPLCFLPNADFGGAGFPPPVDPAGCSITQPLLLQPPVRKMCYNTFQRGSVARWNVGQNNPGDNKCEVGQGGREWIAICHHRYHPHPHNHPQPSALHQPKRPFSKGSHSPWFSFSSPDFPSALLIFLQLTVCLRGQQELKNQGNYCITSWILILNINTTCLKNSKKNSKKLIVVNLQVGRSWINRQTGKNSFCHRFFIMPFILPQYSPWGYSIFCHSRLPKSKGHLNIFGAIKPLLYYDQN